MWKATPEGIVILVKVIPNSQKNAILGWENGELKIRVVALPVKGGANQELLVFLSKQFNISILQSGSNLDLDPCQSSRG